MFRLFKYLWYKWYKVTNNRVRKHPVFSYVSYAQQSTVTEINIPGTLIIRADNIVLLSNQGINAKGYNQGVFMNPPMLGYQPIVWEPMVSLEDNAPYCLIVQYDDKGNLITPVLSRSAFDQASQKLKVEDFSPNRSSL